MDDPLAVDVLGNLREYGARGQRHEDATAQRLCNYCGGETQGAVMPQRGEDRTDSYFRGTRMGSGEKRIRGIVPPNMDIIGQTAYGGLRYCKKPSTFTSEAHYYSDEFMLGVVLLRQAIELAELKMRIVEANARIVELER